jgi:hypothetical protein
MLTPDAPHGVSVSAVACAGRLFAADASCMGMCGCFVDLVLSTRALCSNTPDTPHGVLDKYKYQGVLEAHRVPIVGLPPKQGQTAKQVVERQGRTRSESAARHMCNALIQPQRSCSARWGVPPVASVMKTSKPESRMVLCRVSLKLTGSLLWACKQSEDKLQSRQSSVRDTPVA